MGLGYAAPIRFYVPVECKLDTDAALDGIN
jgi:hypothetical protein